MRGRERERERERVTVESKMLCFHTVTQEAKVVRETIPFHLLSKSIASQFLLHSKCNERE
jgi:hypothetical protein